MSSPSPAPARRRAFTLIELIVVISIIALLLALVVPGTTSILSANQLSTQGAALLNHLAGARQLAIAENRAVEVRLYYHTDPERTVDTVAVRGILRVTYDSGGNPVPSGEVFPLRSGHVISMDPELSTLAETGSVALLTGTDPGAPESLYPASPGAPYLAFRFHNDGSTNLPAEAEETGDEAPTWHLTLVSELQAATATGSDPPKNYFGIGVDPLTGRLRAFRP